MIAPDILSTVDPKQVERLLLDRYQHDPIGYRHQMLGVDSTLQQDEVSLSVRDNQKTLVQAANGVGKTHLSAGLAQWYFDCFTPSITLTTAPSWSSVTELLWAELANQRRMARNLDTQPFAAFWQGTPTQLRVSDLHYAKGHNARTAEGFQGRHEERLFIILDEGPGVPTHIWKACNTMLQSPLTRLLVIGNPTVTSGDYYDARTDPTFNVIRMNALTHPNIKAELEGRAPPLPKAVRLSWVQQMIDKHCSKVMLGSKLPVDAFQWKGDWYVPNDEFRSRVLGLFPRRASNAIWDEALIERCREQQQEPVGPPELGCDVARFGSDATCLFGRAGSCALFGEQHYHRDTVQVAQRCIELAGQLGRTFGVDPTSVAIKVDDAGVGGGVTDFLRYQGYNVTGVNSANVAIDAEKYPNKRSELWFVSEERAAEGRLDLTRLSVDVYNQLKKDLLTPTYKLDGHNRRVVEPKDETRKRLDRSPDMADAFNLANAKPDDNSSPLIAPTVVTKTSMWV